MDQIFLRLLHRFGNGDWHFRCFALADADPPLAVSDHHERTKIEALTALDDFCHAIDEDNFVFQT